MLSIDKQMLFLLTRVPSITVQRFIEIYTARGYSQQSVRNVLSRLKGLGYIETVERSNYAITDHGRRTLSAIAGKGFLYGAEWDGQWQLVTFEIPDSERSKRYQLRNSLINLGFAPLYKNTFISPWNYVDEVNRLTVNLELQSNITQMKGSFQHFAITRELAAKMWNLDNIRAIQKEKILWFYNEYMPAVEKLKEEGNALQLFIRYLELGESMSEYIILDPMLPAELLPPDWQGQQVLELFYRNFSTLYHCIPEDAYYYAFMKDE
ncbi:hypothetical protein K0T92_16730 [Paenibacillus oenotherae]|uniref:PaaX family transcriptional regulator n=1 Tax=Paenibacillus oenotherae TaxID=1435645 RepID=A0ABS7D929_9BACL|nr:PaaX family transcriptional regulator C-terminal domain-containing protein [Paenibacillus oenotherae]MBW7476380.1 hypothetical protein [Paenibacillus oenotherae]